MTTKLKESVEKLLEKATHAVDGTQAMHFTQAACNAANAIRMLGDIERLGPTTGGDTP